MRKDGRLAKKNEFMIGCVDAVDDNHFMKFIGPGVHDPTELEEAVEGKYSKTLTNRSVNKSFEEVDENYEKLRKTLNGIMI